MSKTCAPLIQSTTAPPAYVGLTPSVVNTLLVKVLERATGLGPGRVLIESETRPRPGTHEAKGLYCTIGWKLFEPLPQNGGDFFLAPKVWPDGDGGPEKGKAEPADMWQHLSNETWCTLAVSFWGTGALDAAAKAVSALQNNERQFDLWRTLGFGGVGSIKDESASSGGRFKPACFFDLSFYACFGASYPADWFDVSQWDFIEEFLIPDFEPCPQKP